MLEGFPLTISGLSCRQRLGCSHPARRPAGAAPHRSHQVSPRHSNSGYQGRRPLVVLRLHPHPTALCRYKSMPSARHTSTLTSTSIGPACCRYPTPFLELQAPPWPRPHPTDRTTSTHQLNKARRRLFTIHPHPAGCLMTRGPYLVRPKPLLELAGPSTILTSIRQEC